MKQNAKEPILAAGREEFLTLGFKDASLRTIAQKAGVTTGAIYAHYPDKEALFTALVEPAATTFLDWFVKQQKDFTLLPEQEQIQVMNLYTDESLGGFLDYLYDHFDAFRLIIACSAGTAYEGYVEQLVDAEAEGTDRFIAVLRRHGYPVNEIADSMSHILASAMFTAMFEAVRHNMPKEEAVGYVKGVKLFFNAGWNAVLGLD